MSLIQVISQREWQENNDFGIVLAFASQSKATLQTEIDITKQHHKLRSLSDITNFANYSHAKWNNKLKQTPLLNVIQVQVRNPGQSHIFQKILIVTFWCKALIRLFTKTFKGCCMVCGATSNRSDDPYKTTTLKRCSRCRCVAYCSVEHQKCHWKYHKALCNYLSAAAGEVGADTFFAAGTGLLIFLLAARQCRSIYEYLSRIIMKLETRER